jgi:hypothetical protein
MTKCLHQFNPVTRRCIGCGLPETELAYSSVETEHTIVNVNIKISLPKDVWDTLGSEQRFTEPRIKAMFTIEALRKVIVKIGAAIPAKFNIEVTNL